MLDMKRQVRVSEEAPQQGWMSPQAPTLAADMPADLLDAVRREIREAPVLEVAPEQLDGVQFGRVGGQPDDVPATMATQPRGDDAVRMGAPAIPEEDDRPTNVTGQVLEKPAHLRPSNVPP
jgi:hypothetical protein